jgi:hypothetical protein
MDEAVHKARSVRVPIMCEPQRRHGEEYNEGKQETHQSETFFKNKPACEQLS